MKFKKKSYILLVFLLLATNLIVSAGLNNAVAESNSNCADTWSINSWWKDPVTFKYSPVLKSRSSEETFQGNDMSGLLAPQISDEVADAIKKQGKDIVVTFRVSKVNDLNTDGRFHLVYQLNQSYGVSDYQRSG